MADDQTDIVHDRNHGGGIGAATGIPAGCARLAINGP